MKRLIASELERIFRSKRTKGLLIFYLIMIIANCIFRFKSPSGSYDGVNYNVPLNSLNFSLFVFYEIRFELLYIVLPILFIDSINYEQSIGAFRMYVIRPYKKYEFIISKWIALALTTFILVFIAFIVSAIFGYLFMPKVANVKFYSITHEYSTIGATLYTVRFFIIQFIICLCILSLAAVIGVIINNSIISILAVIAVNMGLGFYTKAFEFLNNTTKYGFYILSGTAPISFYLILIATLLGGIVLSTFLWQKKDYIY